MSWWRVDADMWAGSRFVISPLAETLAALKTLQLGRAAHMGEAEWLAACRPGYLTLLAGDPVTAALVRAALRPRWNATFLTPTPLGDAEHGFTDELARIRRTPSTAARADLEESLNGPLPVSLRRDDLPRRAADLLEWVWTTAVEPSWPQRLRIMEADILARAARLGQHGWAAVLEEMRPAMRWLGEDRLRTTAGDGPPLETSGGQLMFVPVTPSQSWLCWDVPLAGTPRPPASPRCAVIYPCSGVLVDRGLRAAPDALAALLGPARAHLLMLLATPKSTTQLVSLAGLPLGSVGRHLRILRESRLAQRRRAGRSVLYVRTATGNALVEAQGAEAPAF
ncbi:ArsR/SmtB family transcription factor [Streptomyces sp. NPDC048111]|uniref:ArsR/SmtB family transcription factor n=1 Tax=Streptomyces sp. NPDC048111 TaxID=3365500 RepID=UPI003714CB34